MNTCFGGVLRKVKMPESKCNEKTNASDEKFAGQDCLAAYDDIGLPLYIADAASYEVLHENKAALGFLGNIVGKKCFKAICGSDGVCADCIHAEKRRRIHAYPKSL